MTACECPHPVETPAAVTAHLVDSDSAANVAILCIECALAFVRETAVEEPVEIRPLRPEPCEQCRHRDPISAGCDCGRVYSALKREEPGKDVRCSQCRNYLILCRHDLPWRERAKSIAFPTGWAASSHD